MDFVGYFLLAWILTLPAYDLPGPLFDRVEPFNAGLHF
jgi:hypothetical protein